MNDMASSPITISSYRTGDVFSFNRLFASAQQMDAHAQEVATQVDKGAATRGHVET